MAQRALAPRAKFGPASPTHPRHLRRGWYWGTEAFREKLIKLAGKVTLRKKGKAYRTGAIKRAHDMAEAERLVAEGLGKAGLTEHALSNLKGSAPIKVALAEKIWKTTTMDQSWIAKRLWMKSASNVSQILNRTEKATQLPTRQSR
ncbi:MAG: hypothetical protein JNJ83_10075 [Verrucomicrobiaceae bacterium]|nr:hypothetical protein [Verrucomicrobiaceae bacterium]